MPRPLHISLIVLVLALLIGVPLAHSVQTQTSFRNMHVVRPGVLLRSGQLTHDALKKVLRDNGIKTVVTLRDAYEPGKPPPDLAEEQYCNKEEIKYVRIHPYAWWAEVGPAPVEVGIKKFIEVMKDESNYPVLIHCWAGIHRTGAYCAIYRMEFEHWTNAAAMEEMKEMGYDSLDDEWDILGFMERYWPSWKGTPRPEVMPPRRPSVRPGLENKKKKQRDL
jgi:tyrosine-protein phosphatase SIW14